ncbi:hypothetical protein FQN57_001656 [Myotisia sp. PD_48]|nr:hypothetical protein FQN57_001656 [Myotisia sp. PD_48]
MGLRDILHHRPKAEEDPWAASPSRYPSTNLPKNLMTGPGSHFHARRKKSAPSQKTPEQKAPAHHGTAGDTTTTATDGLSPEQYHHAEDLARDEMLQPTNGVPGDDRGGGQKQSRWRSNASGTPQYHPRSPPHGSKQSPPHVQTSRDAKLGVHSEQGAAVAAAAAAYTGSSQAAKHVAHRSAPRALQVVGVPRKDSTTLGAAAPNVGEVPVTVNPTQPSDQMTPGTKPVKERGWRRYFYKQKPSEREVENEDQWVREEITESEAGREVTRQTYTQQSKHQEYVPGEAETSAAGGAERTIEESTIQEEEEIITSGIVEEPTTTTTPDIAPPPPPMKQDETPLPAEPSKKSKKNTKKKRAAREKAAQEKAVQEKAAQDKVTQPGAAQVKHEKSITYAQALAQTAPEEPAAETTAVSGARAAPAVNIVVEDYDSVVNQRERDMEGGPELAVLPGEDQPLDVAETPVERAAAAGDTSTTGTAEPVVTQAEPEPSAAEPKAEPEHLSRQERRRLEKQEKARQKQEAQQLKDREKEVEREDKRSRQQAKQDEKARKKEAKKREKQEELHRKEHPEQQQQQQHDGRQDSTAENHASRNGSKKEKDGTGLLRFFSRSSKGARKSSEANGV